MTHPLPKPLIPARRSAPGVREQREPVARKRCSLTHKWERGFDISLSH